VKEQSAAKAYAKAIYELSNEAKLNVADELVSLNEIINKSNDLENVLFLEVFTPEEKMNVMTDVLKKLNTSALLSNFIFFLITEKRMGLFPMIFKDIIIMDDHAKGFLRGTINGSDENIDQATKEKITTYLKDKLGKNCELDYVQTENITAGYRVTVEDLQLDASLDNQLDKFKKDVLSV
jgi:F-type H+-transporting ATPase subunit delta